jgi:beta-exotoxin I transport system permease protein
MLRNPFTKWLWDARKSIPAWAAAIAAVGGMYAAFWPSIDNPDLLDLLESYPKALMEAINYTDIATAAGYVNATVFGLLVAFLTAVYAIAAGARIVAGDEEAGTLDLVLAHPLSRTRLALERFCAFLVSAAVIAAAVWAVLLALRGPARLDGITIGGLAAQSFHLLLFAAFFGSFAYAVGAASGRRAYALAAGAGVAVLGYAANGVLPQIDGLEWTKRLSPFHWLNGNTPLVNGVDWGAVLLMAGLAVFLVALGTWAFTRRDVAV